MCWIPFLNVFWIGDMNRFLIPGFFMVFAAVAPAGALDEPEYLDAGASVWHLEPVGAGLLATADYDGRIALRDRATARPRWTHATGAFVFDLEVADLDRDGREEILFTTAEGRLGVLDLDGRRLWSFQAPLPLFEVVAGNFAGDDRLEVATAGIDRLLTVLDAEGRLLDRSVEVQRVAHRLAAGDLGGDSYDELLVIESREYGHALQLRPSGLATLWRKRLEVPADMVNWENPRGSFFPFSLEIADLDGDGANEILMGDTFFNKQSVMVADANGEGLWISERLPAFRQVDGAQIEFYSTAFVRAADVFSDIPGKEVVSVAAGMFRIWDKDGRLLGARNSALGFTDFELDGKEILLGSCPNGDTFLYRFRLDEDWRETVGRLAFQGRIREIREHTRTLKAQVLAYSAPDGAPLPSYDLIPGFGRIKPTAEDLRLRREQEAWFRERYPYPNLEIIHTLKVMEPTPPLDERGEPWFPYRWRVDSINGTDTVEEILDKARWVEENRVPTLFYIGHSCMPFITLETAERILQLAPNYCLGFYTMEDENLELIPRYFEHYFHQLADLCVEYGNKLFMTKNKGLWWMTAPAREPVFDAMFAGGREAVTLAGTEDSNSRTPEINLMARGGLWQAGLLRHNDVSIHRDIFSFNRFHQWEYPRVGHPFLRLLVAHTTVGMTHVSSRIRDIGPVSDADGFQDVGRESTEIFYHMLGKGLVFSPKPEDAMGYAPIGLAVHRPPADWLTDAHNGHSPERWSGDPALHRAVLPHNGSLWGMTRTPDHALTRVLFQKERQFGLQVPPTPYGLVAIVPAHADLDAVAGVSEWWHTDGVALWKEGGPRLTGPKAARALEADFQAAAARLPFRQLQDQAVFLNVLRVRPGHYRLFLVDPGWLDPSEREVDIGIQLEGAFAAVDVLSGRKVAIHNRRLPLTVPAGLFRIIDVMRK